MTAATQAESTRATWQANAWYVACTPDEIAEKPLARRICGQAMVFYRGKAGATALEDFCPHRGAPLSLGSVRDGELVCGYHGLVMGCDGKTASMPGQRVTAFPAIKAFPVIERYGFIWVWPGEADLATEDALPDLFWAESPDWAYGGGLFHINCDYRLMIDNLMDLTHETYVHSNSIGQKEIEEAPVVTRMAGDEVITQREMHGITAPPFWRMALEKAGIDPSSVVDRWQVCRFSTPSHVMIEVGVALAGQGGKEAPEGAKASSIVVDFMTPETETSHWYFWGMARSFAVDDESVTASVRQGQHTIFSEDLEMLEQQQKNLLAYPDRRLLKLNIDAGGVRSRMMIEKAIDAEIAQAAARQAVAAE
jgi:vanillate O-demethylase monooxygenase subunit